MKIKIMTVALTATMALAACTNTSDNKAGQAVDETPAWGHLTAELTGTWAIDSIVVNDSLTIRPVVAEGVEVPGFMLTDSTYSVNTGCNSINGAVAMKADSIAFEAGLITEMACDDMQVEDAVRAILPTIATYSSPSDSVMILKPSATESTPTGIYLSR